LFKFVQTAFGLDYIKMALAEHANPCRVISPVFELMQTTDKNFSSISISDISYYSTHILSSVFFIK
jgi:hypothetical protein